MGILDFNERPDDPNEESYWQGYRDAQRAGMYDIFMHGLQDLFTLLPRSADQAAYKAGWEDYWKEQHTDPIGSAISGLGDVFFEVAGAALSGAWGFIKWAGKTGKSVCGLGIAGLCELTEFLSEPAGEAARFLRRPLLFLGSYACEFIAYKGLTSNPDYPVVYIIIGLLGLPLTIYSAFKAIQFVSVLSLLWAMVVIGLAVLIVVVGFVVVFVRSIHDEYLRQTTPCAIEGIWTTKDGSLLRLETSGDQIKAVYVSMGAGPPHSSARRGDIEFQGTVTGNRIIGKDTIFYQTNYPCGMAGKKAYVDMELTITSGCTLLQGDVSAPEYSGDCRNLRGTVHSLFFTKADAR
ncbi:MAG TPA: hypothetical protein VI756_09530 [Blastocatellia bacterium]